ncbi:MAG TPA: hypothetical protein PLR96_14745, partial [Flavobacteriales bacterium]|nr:hypothetical protein [Flavobacteriales bacterium]
MVTRLNSARYQFIAGGLAILVLSGCRSEPPETSTTVPEQQAPALAPTPAFNADSAYTFVERQVAFG